MLRTVTQEPWKYFDGARELKTQRRSMGEPFGVYGEEELPIVEYLTVPSAANMPEGDIVQIQYRDHAGKLRHLFVNNETYLLNDAGRTMERVY